MDEGELAFVMTMRDEATREARAARAELDKLGGRTDAVEIPVEVRSKKARAEIRALEAEIKKADLGMDVDVRVTKAARVRLKELKAELASLDTTADVNVRTRGAETLTEASRGVSNLLTAIVVLGPAVIPILAGLTLAVGGLGSGMIAAAGAGGVLAAAVIGQSTRMVEASKDVTKLSDKLDTQRETISQLRQTLAGQAKGSKAYESTLKKLQTAQANATVTARQLRQEQARFEQTYGPAAKGLERLKKSWSGFLRQTKPQTLALIGEALDAVADVLPQLAPLANLAAAAVRGLIAEFRAWAKGPEAAELLRFFEQEGPGAITSFGHIAGNVFLGVLHLLQAFAPEIDGVVGGLEDMTGRFRDWSAGLDSNEGFQEFLDYAREALPQIGRFLGALVHVTVTLAQAWAPFGGPILAGLTAMLNALADLPTPVVQAFTLALGAALIMLKAWQVAVFAKASAERIGTVATEGYALAQKGLTAMTTTTAGRLGGVAIGIGGVTAAAQKGGGAFSVLGGAASGAMAGAALGSFFPGPGTAVGAIIGGLGGLAAGLLTTGDAAKKSGQDAKSSIGSWQGYAATLDQVTGATTRATRAEALHNLQQSKVLPQLAKYGISAREAVDAVVNGGKARDQLNAKLGAEEGHYEKNYQAAKAYYKALETGEGNRRKGYGDVTLKELDAAQQRIDAAKKLRDAHNADGDAIRRQLGLADKGIAKGREELAVIRTFSPALKKLPRGVQVAVKAKILGRNDIIDLAARYKKMQNIKAITTLIRENGGNPTQKQVERILARAKELARTRAEAKLAAKDNATPTIKRAEGALRGFDGKRATATMTIVRRVVGAAQNAVKNLPFVGDGGYHGGTVMPNGRILRRFRRGGTVPGAGAYRDSVVALLAPTEEVIPNDRGQADAYRADRDAGRIPAYAKGGKVGKKARAAGKAAKRRAAVVHNLTILFDKKGADDTASAIQTVNQRLDTYYGKNKKAAAAAKKSFADEYAALKKNAAARDVVIAKIQAAKDAGIAARDAMLESLDVTSIEKINDAPMTAGFIVQGLQSRVAANQKFINQLAALAKKGVDKNLIADLRQKGAEAAGEYVDALAQATPEQLKAVNTAQAQIRAQAAKIGADTTAGLAVGLASQLKAIDAAGVRLANALLRAMKRRLGIKSPARAVRREVAVQSVAGLIGGLDDGIPAAEAKAAQLAARVAAAAVPTIGGLAQLANSTARLAPTVRADSVIVIRHEVVSPDGSISHMTAAEIADLIARDPKAAAALEKVLTPARRRAVANRIVASDTPT